MHPPRAGAFGGAYAIRPYTGTRTNKPTGRSPQQTNIKRAHRPEWMDAGYDHSPRTGSFGGAYAIRPYPAGRRAFGYPANFAGVRRRPRPNSPVSADTPRQMPRDLRRLRKRHGKRRETPRRLRKRHGKRRETCAACANATANAERPALPAQTPRQTPRDLRRLRKPSENTEQPLTVKILAYGKRQNIDAYRRHHQRD